MLVNWVMCVEGWMDGWLGEVDSVGSDDGWEYGMVKGRCVEWMVTVMGGWISGPVDGR